MKLMMHIIQVLFTYIFVKVRLLKLRRAWKYNQQFVFHLLSQYNGQVIDIDTLIQAQVTYVTQELFNNDSLTFDSKSDNVDKAFKNNLKHFLN